MLPLDSDAFGYKPLLWLGLYACGVIIGLIGLITVVVDNWSDHTRAMEVICGTFGGCALLVTLLTSLALFRLGDGVLNCVFISFLTLVTTIGVLTALWSD